MLSPNPTNLHPPSFSSLLFLLPLPPSDTSNSLKYAGKMSDHELPTENWKGGRRGESMLTREGGRKGGERGREGERRDQTLQCTTFCSDVHFANPDSILRILSPFC